MKNERIDVYRVSKHFKHNYCVKGTAMESTHAQILDKIEILGKKQITHCCPYSKNLQIFSSLFSSMSMQLNPVKY